MTKPRLWPLCGEKKLLFLTLPIILAGMAKFLVTIGLMFLVAGLVLLWFPSAFRWVGRLPGDIRFNRGNFSFYAPLATGLLASLFLSLLLRLLRN
jgi:hypothetical protein